MPCPEKFKETLVKFAINDEICKQINEGYEDLVSSSKKPLKAAYFNRAMKILDQSISPEDMTNLMDENGCCKSGSREKAAKAFYKEHKEESLEEKLPYIRNVPYMGFPELINNNQLLIHAINYKKGDKYVCACPNFSLQHEYDLTSVSYCKCCAGHFRYHYQIMLGVKLKLVEVSTSPFSSNGEMPCSFIFEILS